MFKVINVPYDAANIFEQLGSKPKFWFKDENHILHLFKESRQNTGEDWSEKVTSELCDLISLPHVKYELASWKNIRGVVCPTFVPEGGRLVHGNEILSNVVKDYSTNKFYGVKEHVLKLVIKLLTICIVKVPICFTSSDNIKLGVDVFIGYLMLDAWIANQDRHHENWSVIIADDRNVHLSPTYDHASSLGFNELDKNKQDRLNTNDQRRSINRYVEKAKSGFYDTSNSKKPLSTFEAFEQALKKRPTAAISWLKKLKMISDNDIKLVFQQVPKDLISDISAAFAQRMLQLNRQRLLKLME